MRFINTHLLNNTNKQVMKFGVVGIINTAVDIGIYILLTRLMQFFAIYIFLAKTISFIFSTLSSFTLNKKWTFESKTKLNFKELIRFYITVCGGLIINVSSMYIMVTFLNFHDILAALGATVFTFAWNFTMSKFWVFSKKSKNSDQKKTYEVA